MFFRAESVYQGMKMNYGAHACHLLRINSAVPSTSTSATPDPWARYLRHRLRHFSSLRIQEDEDSSLNENNNGNEAGDGAPPSVAMINGEPVFVTGDQTGNTNNEVTADGPTIPHPLSCNDLPKLETQEAVTLVDKEERNQVVQ